MRQRGRASIILLAGLLSAGLVAVLLFFTRTSPANAAADFMDALLRNDAKRLAQLSYMEGLNEEQVEARWKRTVQFSRYYAMYWKVERQKELSPTTASVVLEVMHEPRYVAYSEKAEMRMVKIDGAWKVDVRRLPRNFFPFLPR